MHVPGFEIVDIVHESMPRIVVRAVREHDGKSVVLKTLADKFPSKRDVAEIRHEFGIAQRLKSAEGIIQVDALVPHGEGNLAIVMESFGLSLPASLARRQLDRLPLKEFLPLAARIARILGQVHERHVVHKDIVPRNVLVDGDDVRLIDFHISSELSRERQGLEISKGLEGSLPYISPEQTGRMNRAVDYRSDYYSLGATFFELLTGQLPFAAGNVLEWIHCHISKPPPSPRSVDPAIPERVSDIVVKLMAKNAEDRYQSAYGLSADLQRCYEELCTSGSIRHFELGSRDVSSRFEIPQRLYGRDAELATLRDCCEQVAAGASELCVVSGYSGVGKSALVNELVRSIASEQGYLIQGKFDQFQHRSAYSAVSQAFRGLARQLLAEPRQQLDAYKQAIVAACTPNAQVLVDLVPELELIIGKQPPVAELPATEAQNRLQIVFVNFVKVFATQGRPLVIFIDDLQWSDAPTLNLIQRLVTARDMGNLFMIGAYRSNEVDIAHPLRLTLDEVRKARAIVELPLQPLPAAAIDQLMADVLHRDVRACRDLSALLCEKSQGNPFFIKEILKSLHEGGAVVFDSDTGRWNWDMDAVRQAEVSDNVAEFMVASLRKLPPASQHVLQLAACIGNVFDLRTLSIICERFTTETAVDLQAALERDVVMPLDENYKIATADAANPSYKFQHDRVQQAAYALIDADRKRHVHLSVGRLIQKHCDEQELAERLIDIVEHLNLGRPLIEEPQERRMLAQLNLQAGIKAHAASAYSSALGFLEIGLELLPDDSWDADYQLTLELSSEYQECSYLTGNHEVAEAWIESMLVRARTPLEQAEILSVRTRQYSTMGKMRESIEAAIAGLSLLGIEISANPNQSMIDAEIVAVERNLGGRAIAQLAHAAPISDPTSRVAIRLLMEIFPAAFLSGSGSLFPFLVLKSVNISLCYGTGPESAFAYAAYGMLLCGVLDDPALGYQYGKLAVEMNERLEDIKLKSRVIYLYAMFIHHWSNHWSSMTPWFKKGIEAGYQSGDLLYLAYSAQDCIIWDPTLDLETAAGEQRKYLNIVRDCEYEDSLDSGTLFLQMQLNFLGKTKSLYSLGDDDFDEGACVAGMLERRFMTGVANHHIYKAEIHFLYDDYDGAMEHVAAQDELIASSMSLPQLVRFYLIAFLTRAARYPALGADERQRTHQRLLSDLAQMKRWASNCADNFAHLQLIMEAELARLAGRTVEALDLYDAAAEAAHRSNFRRDEAMANELCAKCLLADGRAKAAEGYLRSAHYLYYRWGAQRKVGHLIDKYPELLARPAGRGAGATTDHERETSTGWTDSDAIDLHSVMKASRVISGELRLGQLWRTTLEILLENVGGQRGYFVYREQGSLWIEARCEAGAPIPPLNSPIAVEVEGGTPLPMSVINTAMRIGEPLVLNNATEDARFAKDEYIVRERPKSVLCIPVRRHGKFEGAIYIENTLTIGAFTDERVEVIKLLSAQAAISMENAKLYDDQVKLIEAQQRFVPIQFLESLGHPDIATVALGEHVARDMTVMFSDLRGFTSLTERLRPAAVIELMNSYFSSQSGPIAEAGGFIDAYTGDEIMALFGEVPDAAVRAGVRMRRKLEAFNVRSTARGGPTLRMGMGMNTGPLVLGTVGSADRLKCGVVGDVVNVSSRIEQLTKVYQTPFLIGEGTYRKLFQPDSFSLRMVDRVAVRGKQLAITIYEVMDAEVPERREAKEATRDLLAAAQKHFFKREFARVQSVIAEAMAIDPQDAVLSHLAKRAERHSEMPPPPDWEPPHAK